MMLDFPMTISFTAFAARDLHPDRVRGCGHLSGPSQRDNALRKPPLD
jgi:hypothetical protein